MQVVQYLLSSKPITDPLMNGDIRYTYVLGERSTYEVMVQTTLQQWFPINLPEDVRAYLSRNFANAGATVKRTLYLRQDPPVIAKPDSKFVVVNMDADEVPTYPPTFSMQPATSATNSTYRSTMNVGASIAHCLQASTIPQGDLTPEQAWVQGIIVGFPDATLLEFAREFSWTLVELQRLQHLRQLWLQNSYRLDTLLESKPTTRGGIVG